MLHDPASPRLSEFDERVYAQVVPPEHFLRKVLWVVPIPSQHSARQAHGTPG